MPGPRCATPTTRPSNDVPPRTMTLPTRPTEPPSSVPATVVFSALALLAFAVLAGGSVRLAGGLVVVATIAALVRPVLIGWPRLVAALILIILFIPIRRYTLPANLPFQLEPYRVFVALLVLGWLASLLVDSRIAFRRTGFEGPLLVIVGAAFASIVANPGRVAHVSTFVDKSLMFFLSFVLVLYLIASVIRRLEDVDYLAKTLVIGGAVVAISADRRGAHRVQRLQPPLSRRSRSCTAGRSAAPSSSGSEPGGSASSAPRSTRSHSAPRSSCSCRSAIYLARRLRAAPLDRVCARPVHRCASRPSRGRGS